MANTLKFGNGQWATGNGTALAYNDENANFKPLPFDFTRASSGTVVNQSGLIETVGSGIPRIDFLGNTKGALLLEPSRTNLITYSEDFSQAIWNKTGLTVSSNQIISPDGSLNADEINITGANAHFLFENISVNASTNYVLTFYAKKGTATDVSYSIYDNTNGADIIASTSYYSQISNTNWSRITVEFTTPSGCTSVRPYPLRDGSSTGTVYIWGAQLEAGSYATSYIPTSGSAVTKVAESCAQTAPDGVIGQTEGVIFLDIQMPSAIQSSTTFSIGGGSSGEYAQLEIRSDLSINWRYRQGNVDYINANVGSYVGGDRLKLAFAYKNGDSVLYKNGVSIATDTGSISSNSWNNVYFSNFAGTGKLNADVNQTSLYNTRLSNAELQALTTI